MFNNFLGKDGFIWWIGVVEDRHDPAYLGRCKVRIHGWHTADKKDMPTEALPWCYPLMPITSGSMTGVGISPTGPVEGTWIMGFFRDGENAQHPVMLGTFHGVPNYDVSTKYTKDLGFYDPRMYDGTKDSSEHDLDINAMNLRVGIRSLKYLPGESDYNVPREPLMIEPYTDTNTKTPTGDGILIVEIPMRSPYPDIRYTGEPTTPRMARGKSDPTSNLQTDPNGIFIGQGPKALKDRIRRLYLNNIIVPHEYFNSTKTKVTLVPPSEFEAENVTDLEPQKDLKFWTEYQGTFNPKYPYNHVQQTESGHLIEYDDTPGSERLHWYHRSGTFTEFHARGDRVDRIHGEHTHSVFRSFKSKIFGHKFENIEKSYGIRINERGMPRHNYSIWIGKNSSMYTKLEGGNYYFDNQSQISGVDDVKTFGTTQFDTENFIVNANESITLNCENIVFGSNSLQSSIGFYKEEVFDDEQQTTTYTPLKEYRISSRNLNISSSIENHICNESYTFNPNDYLKNTTLQDWEIIRNSSVLLGAVGTETLIEGPIAKRITAGVGDTVIESLGGSTSAIGGVYLLAGGGPVAGALDATASAISITGNLKSIQGSKKSLTSTQLASVAKSKFILDSTGTITSYSTLDTSITSLANISLTSTSLLQFTGNPVGSLTAGSTFTTAPSGNLKKWLDALLDVLINLTVGTGVGPSSTPVNSADIQLLKTQLATFMG